MSLATLPQSFQLDARHLCRGSSRLERSFPDLYADAQRRSCPAAEQQQKQQLFALFQSHLRRRGQLQFLQFCLDVDAFRVACASRCAAVSLACESQRAAASGSPAAEADLAQSQRQSDRLRHLIKSDAVSLYKAYLAPESEPKLPIDDSVRVKMIEALCSESNGCIQPDSFDTAQDAVLAWLNTHYCSEFLSSPLVAEYQLNVLTNFRSELTISDIVYCSSLVFNFMEFLDSRGGARLLQFLFDVRNFEANVSSPQHAAADALCLYDKYFSLQATCGLGFDDEFRVEVEVAMCPADCGQLVRPDCFERSKQLVLQFLQAAHLPDYLSSDMLSNHLASLTYVVDTACLAQRHQRQDSSHSPSQQARAYPSQGNSSARHGGSVHSEPVTSSDYQRSIVNFGRVDHLGRFHSDLDKIALAEQPSMAERLLKRFSLGRDQKFGQQQQQQQQHQHQQLQQQVTQDPSVVAESIINEVKSLTRRSASSRNP